jgi:hypothetical protein
MSEKFDEAEAALRAGGDIECCPHPTGEQAVDVVRGLCECYDEFIGDWNNHLK